jgi:hypothetical protein
MLRRVTEEDGQLPTTGEAEMPKQKPAHEIRLDRVKATIWANETENGTRHNVTVSRIYKDGDEWKQTTSFGRDDLPLVAKVVDLAHLWIYEQAG